MHYFAQLECFRPLQPSLNFRIWLATPRKAGLDYTLPSDMIKAKNNGCKDMKKSVWARR